MSYAITIIERLGGTRRVARLLSLTPSTVQSWKDSGEIPAPRQRQLLGAARDNGLKLSADDFFQDGIPSMGDRCHPPTPKPRRPRKGADEHREAV